MNKLYEEIARVAYELYEKRGKGEGYHFDDWVEAEKVVRARHEKSSEKPAETVKRRTTAGTAREKRAAGDGKPAPKKRAVARKTTAKKTT